MLSFRRIVKINLILDNDVDNDSAHNETFDKWTIFFLSLLLIKMKF